ncbi:MAG TPA: hypothetical protein VNO21_12600, partial [Polyangiaceae bacterium]|nr:hypothetical protein [Polyangiaceae bacterium]
MSLSSLVVQSEIATMRQVEEALARQVLYGGDFITNLFEVAAIDEAALTHVAAEAHGLSAAPTGVLPPPERRARSMIPAELASHRSLYPLASSEEGDELVVVVAEPLAAQDEEQLTFALGVPIVQCIAPLVRIRQALHREFGAPLERRFERLLARLEGDARAGLTSSDLPPLLRDAPSAGPPPRPPSTPPYRTSRVPGATSGMPNVPDVSAVPPPPPVPTFPTSRPPARSVPPGVIQARVEVLPPPPDPHGLATLVRESSVISRPIRRRRGPLTLDAAGMELESVADRDQLLDLFFDLARQYFDYSALFIVHGDLAEGREAFGAGASRDRVAGIGVPLDLPSLFASARDTRQPVVVRPDSFGLDGVLLKDLERVTDRTIMAVPVVVR